MPLASIYPLLALAALLDGGTVETYPGDTDVQVPVKVTAEYDEEIAAATVTLAWDAAAAALGEAVIGPAAESAGKTVTLNSTGPSSVRVVVAGLNQDGMPDGVLFYLSFNVLAAASAGIHEITLSEAALSDPFGQPVAATVTSGALDVRLAGEGEREGEPALEGGCQCASGKAGAQGVFDLLSELFVGALALALLLAVHFRYPPS